MGNADHEPRPHHLKFQISVHDLSCECCCVPSFPVVFYALGLETFGSGHDWPHLTIHTTQGLFILLVINALFAGSLRVGFDLSNTFS